MIPSFPTQGVAKIHPTQCQLFAKVGGTLSMANYNAVPDFVAFFAWILC